MHKHVCRPIFDFIFNKVLIFLNLNAHKMHNWVISSYFEIMEFLGCYSFGSPSILMRPRSLKPRLHAIHDFQMCHVVLRFILWVYTYRVPTTIRPMTKWLHHDVLGWFMQYLDNCSIEWVKVTQYSDEEFLFQQFSGYRIGHFTSFWLLGFSDHFHKSKLLLTTRQDTSDSLPLFSLWQHNESKTSVSGTKLPGLLYLVVTTLLSASVYPSRPRHRYLKQQLIANGQTSIGTLEELTWDYWMREHVSHHKAFSTCLNRPFCFAPLWD